MEKQGELFSLDGWLGYLELYDEPIDLRDGFVTSDHRFIREGEVSCGLISLMPRADCGGFDEQPVECSRLGAPRVGHWLENEDGLVSHLRFS